MTIGCRRKGHSLPLHLSSPLVPLPLLSLSISLPLSLSACVSLSHSLGVTTAAPRCVRKLECHVLTGVRGMLTGQTEGTDGSMTCPRSSGVPLSAARGLKPNAFSPASFSFLQDSSPSFSSSPLFHLWFFLSPLPFTSLSFIPSSVFHSPPLPLFRCLPSLSYSSFLFITPCYPPQCTVGHKASCTGCCLSLLKHTGPQTLLTALFTHTQTHPPR